MSTLLYPVSVIDYPDEDGQPMAESDFQRTPLIYAVESLRIYFQESQRQAEARAEREAAQRRLLEARLAELEAQLRR